MSTKTQLEAADGHVLAAWRSDPAGKPKGGIVVLHAVYGLTTHMGDVCDRWASEGYAAVAPALFDRHRPNLVNPYSDDGVEAGRKAYASLSEDGILSDIAACANALSNAGPLIVSGFCTGGTWAWVAAARQNFDAQVNFYGSQVVSRLDLAPRCPSIVHYGDQDFVVPVPDIEKIRAAHPGIELHVYPGAGHAFLNPEQHSHDAAATAKAWSHSLAFLESHLQA